ncbi:relaxase [Actinomadura sp. WMMB 499]|uniref:relaxase/mobilization nuclease domain-containing protein n=1 Tax=Actinomadura sp. WMMB 499 TaxID=1219491 RepID=UPI001244168E|nr:relaxase [Actinomadura sp. WMMB 499]QFG21103.1 relaxase [Actinomadura sp. WMMB 499]
MTDVLRSPLETLRRSPPGKPVWQCSLRTAPADRVLSDDEWAEAAEELMHQTGIAPRRDPDACRWIAVRHADDHVHVVAMLAREDGRRPDVTRDCLKARKACRVLEERWGLHRTAPADRTAAPRPTRPEIERARRAGGREPTRCALRRQVAAVAASAGGEEAFFAGLRERGLLVRLRFSVRTPGEITGFAVADPSYTNAAKAPIYFSGGKLAADLTLPKLRHRWGAASADVPSARRAARMRRSVVGFDERKQAYREAARAAATAARHMRQTSDPRVRADIAAAASDVLHVAADITGNRELAEIADVYGRAAREPFGRPTMATRPGNGLRVAARLVAAVNIGTGDQRDRRRDLTVELLFLVANLLDVVDELAAHREAQGRTAQAQAARRAGDRLRVVGRGASAAQVRPTPPNVAEVQAAGRLAAESFPVPLADGLRHIAARPSRPIPQQSQTRRGPKL